MSVEVHAPTAEEAQLFDELEGRLAALKWPVKRPHVDRSRANVLQEGEEEIRAFAMGKVRKYDVHDHLVESQYNRKFPELYTLLKRLIRLHDPHFRYNAIQLNANVQTAPHYDRNNAGRSYCLAVGTFTGGGLVLYPPAEGGSRPQIVRNRRKWALYDGAHIKHGSAPVHSGTRYAVIFYQATPPPGAKRSRRRKSR